VQEIAPWFTNCDDITFSGYDPPKTLVLASAMVADLTSIDPLVTPTSPRPSPTQDPGARKTAAATDPPVAAAYTAASSKPKETSNAAADPQQQGVPDPGFQSSQPRTQQDGHTESGSATHSIDHQQQSGVAGSLGQAVYSSAPNEAMPTNIGASNGKNAQPEVGTGKDSDLQQSSSASQHSGDPTNSAARSKITNPAQQGYAERVSGDPAKLADTSKASTSPQPDNAGVKGQGPAEGTAPSKPLTPGHANYANGADGGSGEADGTSKTDGPAQTSYARGNDEDAGHNAKTSNTSIPQYTREGSDPSNPLPDQRSQIDSALASAPQMSTPTQYAETTSAVGEQSQTSNTAGNGAHTEPGADTDRPSSPAHSIEGNSLLPFLQDHIFNAVASAAHKPTPAQNQGPKLHQSVSPSSEGGPESGNSPLGTLQSSAKPNASGQENSRVPAATISIEDHAAIISPSGVWDPPDVQSMGQVQTIDGEIIAPLSNGIPTLGAFLTPGAQPTTMSGTGTFLAPGGLVVGTGSVKLAPAPTPEPWTTTIAGQAIIANPTAIEVAGSTISAGGPNVVIGGQTVSLDSSSNMIVGSKSVFLATSSAGLGELVIGGFRTESDSSINTYKLSDPTRGRSSSSMDLSSNYAGSPPTNARLTSGRTGATPPNETGSSSSNVEPSSVDSETFSTNAAQGNSETGPLNSPAPTGRATSPRTGLLWKLTVALVVVILILI